MHKYIHTVCYLEVSARLQYSLRGKYLKSHSHISCHISSLSLLILNCTSGPGSNAIIKLFLSGARVSKMFFFSLRYFYDSEYEKSNLSLQAEELQLWIWLDSNSISSSHSNKAAVFVKSEPRLDANQTCLISFSQPKPENAITIAVSSRVLFSMEKEQQIFERQGMEDYIKYQVEHETQPLSPGPAFSFVKVRGCEEEEIENRH